MFLRCKFQSNIPKNQYWNKSLLSITWWSICIWRVRFWLNVRNVNTQQPIVWLLFILEGLAPCGRRSLDSLMLKEFSESDIFCKRWFYFVALRPWIDSGGGNKIKATILRTVAFAKFFVAEREGFEPPVQLPVHRISSAARSTTPASFLSKALQR